MIHHQEGRTDLPNRMIRAAPSTCQGRWIRMMGEQHAHRNKNSTANVSRSGSDSFGRPVAEFGFVEHQPAKKAPRANDTPNSSAEVCDSQRNGQHRQREKFARIVLRDPAQDHGIRRPTDQQQHRHEGANLASVMPRLAKIASARRDRALLGRQSRASAGSSTSASTMARSSTTSQPTAMRPCAYRVGPVLQRPKQHHVAGDRQREAKQAAAGRPAHSVATAIPGASPRRSARSRRERRCHLTAQDLAARNAGRRRTSAASRRSRRAGGQRVVGHEAGRDGPTAIRRADSRPAATA